jgi:hypothetical protein
MNPPFSEQRNKLKGQRPFMLDGIAVFEKSIPDGQGGVKQIYELSDDRTKIKYIACPKTILGYALTQAQVVELYCGQTLSVNAQKKDGTGSYELLLGSTGVIEKAGRNIDPKTQKPYVDRRLNIVTGFPVKKRLPEGATPAEKRKAPVEAFLVAQSQDSPRDVKFYRFVGSKTDPVKLELGDCYLLLEKTKFIRNTYEVTLEGIKELPDKDDPAKVYKTAQVKVRTLSTEEKAALDGNRRSAGQGI